MHANTVGRFTTVTTDTIEALSGRYGVALNRDGVASRLGKPNSLTSGTPQALSDLDGRGIRRSMRLRTREAEAAAVRPEVDFRRVVR